jgi:hypothetical protein
MQYVYTMHKVGKIVPPKKEILRNISLSFFPGAKIGVHRLERRRQVVAAQDHGRSSTTEFSGEARLGARVHRWLPPSGAATRSREGRAGNVMDGVSDVQDLIAQYNAVMAKPGPKTPTSTSSAPSRRRSRTRSPPPTPGASSATSTSPATRCLPPDDADVTRAVGR